MGSAGKEYKFFGFIFGKTMNEQGRCGLANKDTF